MSKVLFFAGASAVLLSFACSGDESGPRTPQLAAGSGGTGAIGGAAGAGTSGFNPGGAGGSTPPPTDDDFNDIVPWMRDDTSMSGLSPDEIDELRDGTGECTAAIVYPTEGTMFPGGLLPPTIMWPIVEGQAQGGAYVHMAYEGATNKAVYEFAVNGETAGEIVIPGDAWTEITQRTNLGKLLVTVKAKIDGAVQSCSSFWYVARGNMVGSVYYGTYSSGAFGGGGIMRLPLGAPASELFVVSNLPALSPSQGHCVGCHSMSFRGNMIAASDHFYPGFGPVEEQVFSFDISSGQPLPPNGPVLDNGAFGALTPDGQLMLTMGSPDCTINSETVHRSTNNFVGVEGPAVAQLIDVKTGHPVQASGLDPNFYMWMPQFSPDGTKVVFNHAKPDPNRAGFTDRRQLAVMDYDQATHTFSNLKVIVGGLGPAPSRDYSPLGASGGTTAAGRNGCTARNPNDPAGVGAIPLGACAEPCFPGWPFFTPDNKGVIFTLMSEPDFASAFPGRYYLNPGHLYYVDIASGKAVRLDNAMKVARQEEYGFEFYPTVLPVVVGGYAWVFWTTKRSWGTREGGIGDSLKEVLGEDNPLLAGLGDLGALGVMGDASAKKIWVSAVRLPRDGEFANSGQLTDPSYPAFYLEGQSNTGNIRAFAALNPCKADGQACTSGIDCCSGFCIDGVCGVPEEPTCSKAQEACTTNEDCCPPEGQAPRYSCFGGFCGYLVE